MRWAALYRRPPILRGVSTSQIRVDHAANQAQINARYGPALPSSLRWRSEPDAAQHSAMISHARASGGEQANVLGFDEVRWNRVLLLLLAKHLPIGLAIRIEAITFTSLPSGFQFGLGDVPIRAAFLQNGS